jgi:hypothetical protein
VCYNKEWFLNDKKGLVCRERPHSFCPPTPPFDYRASRPACLCGGLITRNSQTGELSYSGQYKAFRHIAPYVTSAFDIYSVSVTDRFGQCIGKYPQFAHPIEGFVIDNHDGKKIAVLINPNDAPLQSQITLNGKLWYVEMRADSIATLIVEK